MDKDTKMPPRIWLDGYEDPEAVKMYGKYYVCERDNGTELYHRDDKVQVLLEALRICTDQLLDNVGGSVAHDAGLVGVEALKQWEDEK